MKRQKAICKFNKAQYLFEEEICIHLPDLLMPPEVTIYKLEDIVRCSYSLIENMLVIKNLPVGNYGINISSQKAYWEGAFDIVYSHREVTRYGFLSDFSSKERGISDIEWMRELHLNAVQFYDWMYRHDELLPRSRYYSDPMGRDMDLEVVKSKINACNEFGMRPFAYGAVYAATKDTFNKHPDWAVYTMDGHPMTFAQWLYYMDISSESGWSQHLVSEYQKAVELGFAGIHMDTYGFPKHVWTSQKQPLDLATAFAPLISKAAETVRKVNDEGGVIFNAVNNWPVEEVAQAPQDAVYIEVWPPHDTYFDLYSLVRKAKMCAEKDSRSVVLAAYLKPFQSPDLFAAECAFRLTWATIAAAGGTQLVIGEEMGILRDSYYVNYAKIREDFLPVVQKYCDFLVRYAQLMYNDVGVDITQTASGGINEDICFEGADCIFSTDGKADTVWTILRESNDRITIQLINLRANNSYWNEAKNPANPANKVRIQFRLDRELRGIYCASPDSDSLNPIKLNYSYSPSEQGRIYTVDIPDILYWMTIWVQLEE